MKQIILALLISLWCCGFCAAQQEDVPSYEETLAKYEDLFSVEEALHLTLKFDVKALKQNRDQDVFLDAEMTQKLSDDNPLSQTVQVTTGQSFRRDYCTLPPIWLNMGPAGTKAGSLQDGTWMKMLVRCKNAAQFEPYVLREYLAYKIYNFISPYSYRVRLVRLTLIDTGKNNKETEEWAFLEEPDELMSRRLNCHMVGSDRLSMKLVNPEIFNSLSMFQYMIGNADYSVTGQHNVKIMALKEYGPTGFIPVPCNFDFSGLVNTHYAAPGKDLGTNSVRERYYLGLCLPKQVHEKTIQELALFEEQIMEYIKDFEYLDDKGKEDMIEYLKTYFNESRESGFIDRKISSTCR